MTRLAAAYPTLLSFLLAFLTVFVRELCLARVFTTISTVCTKTRLPPT